VCRDAQIPSIAIISWAFFAPLMIADPLVLATRIGSGWARQCAAGIG
jgi:hypothetical protein